MDLSYSRVFLFEYFGGNSCISQISIDITITRNVLFLSAEDGWKITTVRVEDDGKGGCVEVGDEEVILAKFVAIATGHHAKTSWPKFPGQESFKGLYIVSLIK